MFKINIPEIKTHEISTIISAIANSASGYDELPASILKQCIETYIEPLTYLINMSIAQGIFPDPLKIARMISIFKGENEQLVQNYRPISVLPFLSNIFSKIVVAYDTEFLEDHHNIRLSRYLCIFIFLSYFIVFPHVCLILLSVNVFADF